jgi:hypothetical protein
MTSYWYVLLIPAALLFGWLGATHNAREQAVFLERIADVIEHAPTIPPETERAIKDALASVRGRIAPVDGPLQERRKLAIERIEAMLSAKDVAQTTGFSSRNGRRNLALD